MPLTLLVCDDHPIVRSGLVALLSAVPDIEVVAEAGDGLTAVELCQKYQPSVVLLDLSLPLLGGLEATARIRASCPATRVLILSMHDDGASVAQARAAGASGYLVKGVDLLRLQDGVRRVGNGEDLFDDLSGELPPPLEVLTLREREVLKLIAEGYTNREPGLLLQISPKTVEKHRQSLMDKLQAHDTASLTRRAVAMGIVRA